MGMPNLAHVQRSLNNAVSEMTLALMARFPIGAKVMFKLPFDRYKRPGKVVDYNGRMGQVLVERTFATGVRTYSAYWQNVEIMK